MNDVRARVARCFLNVFPDIKPEELPAASAASLKAWDSVAQVSLMSSIEEEFNLQLEIDAFEQLLSYDSIVGYLEAQSTHG